MIAHKIKIAQDKLDAAGKIGDLITIQHRGLKEPHKFIIRSTVGFDDEQGAVYVLVEPIDREPFYEWIKEDGTVKMFNINKKDCIILPVKPSNSTITRGCYVLKEDIPNEDIFNKIKEKLIEAGGRARLGYGLWESRYHNCYLAIGLSPDWDILWLSSLDPSKRLTVEQLLGNDGLKDPQYLNDKADDVVSIEMTKADVVILRSILGKTWLCSKLYNSLAAEKYAKENIFRHFSWPDIQNLSKSEVNKLVSKVFVPAQPTEKELRQAKIQELRDKLKELEELDND